MIAPHITTHSADALSRVLTQYQGYPRVTGLVAALCAEIQTLEDMLFDVDTSRNLTTPPFGQQLDNIGTLLNAPRNSMPDDDYLPYLRGIIGEHHSDGTASAIINAAQSLYDAVAVFLKGPNSPGYKAADITETPSTAGMALGIGTPRIARPAAVIPSLMRSIAAGVSIYYVSSFDAGGSFAMAGGQVWTNDGTTTKPHTGFGDKDDSSVGGGFATLLYDTESLRP